ncbi:N-acetyltransferase [Glycomyces sp. A-F 0318]|uniref:GNAT family N-acetyltransferase n=1 Tax=Glycomyces amatae TaxID=2881355 RepID=UPI001E5F820B|nr:GNAT family N-acetyltransferase [Glycomyces amatae]MCD0444200.1 N-acetyltransferase [Glycomyces amatae]
MADGDEGMVTLTGPEQDEAGPASPAPAAGLVITENSERGVYEAALDGETVAGLVYSRAGGRVSLLATSVLPEHRGRGVAVGLLGAVLDRLRARGETAIATCPFAAAFIDAHPEYRDVLDPATPRHRTAGG